jgi:hypothetical protein
VPLVPAVAEVPDVPEVPDVAEVPLLPAVPDVPLVPLVPLLPDVPIVPEVSANTIPSTATRIPFSSLIFKSPEIRFCINFKRI